jgi:hypothetical protein
MSAHRSARTMCPASQKKSRPPNLPRKTPDAVRTERTQNRLFFFAFSMLTLPTTAFGLTAVRLGMDRLTARRMAFFLEFFVRSHYQPGAEVISHGNLEIRRCCAAGAPCSYCLRWVL